MLALLQLDFLLAILRITTPLLLAAVGGLIAWRAGVINLGLEGYMLIGAFTASAGTTLTGNVGLGLLICCVTVGLVAIAMNWAVVLRGADQIVTGIMFNIFALGLTTYLGSLVQEALGPGATATTRYFSPVLASLRSIPLFGALLEVIDPFLIVALLLVAAMAYVLRYTSLGLSIIAVGENARAADAAGIHVSRYRGACYVLGSVIAGLGGAFLSLSYIGMFTTNMTAGQGYIAIAIIILGRWRPLMVLLASLVFGFAFALQARQQQLGQGLPVEVVLAFPYLLTLGIVAVYGKSNGPAEEGRPFVRGSR